MTWLKRALFAVATLVLFLALVEALLALFGVVPLARERDPLAGFSERVRVYELAADGGVIRTRPQAVVHSFHAQQFAARKPADGYRVFVLGGSSAFGFPWGAQSAFPRLLGAALQASEPERTLETINSAAMSYGSHRLLVLARELLDYEPDAFVIYGGHNEFIERRFYRDILERRRALDGVRALLARWRLYSWLSRWRDRARAAAAAAPGPGGAAPDGGPTTGELLGLDVVRENSTEVGPAEVERVRATFESNLRTIVAEAQRRGVAVVLCTVPSNIRDWQPNQSFFGPEVEAPARREVRELLDRARRALGAGFLHDPASAGAEAVRAALPLLEGARELAPAHAGTWFLLGRAYERLERYSEAGAAYRAARDCDAQPSRAPTPINETIRAVAHDTGALLVDVERDFDAAAPHGLPGFDLFEDYVHPKPAAHRRIARAVWSAFLERGLLGAPRVADPAIFDRSLAELGPAASSGGPDAPAAAEGRASLRQIFNLGLVLENQGLDEQAMEKYRAVLARSPQHHAARHNLARLLARAGRLDEAETEYRIALETARADPIYPSMLIGLADAVRGLGRLDEAIALLREATAKDPGSALGWQRLGDALAQAGRAEEAESAVRRALALDAGDVEARVRLGMLQLVGRRIAEAEASFRRVLEAHPEHLAARDGLAAALVESGDLDAGERIFREVLREAPDDAMARGGLEIIERRRGQPR